MATESEIKSVKGQIAQVQLRIDSLEEMLEKREYVNKDNTERELKRANQELIGLKSELAHLLK